MYRSHRIEQCNKYWCGSFRLFFFLLFLLKFGYIYFRIVIVSPYEWISFPIYLWILSLHFRFSCPSACVVESPLSWLALEYHLGAVLGLGLLTTHRHMESGYTHTRLSTHMHQYHNHSSFVSSSCTVICIVLVFVIDVISFSVVTDIFADSVLFIFALMLCPCHVIEYCFPSPFKSHLLHGIELLIFCWPISFHIYVVSCQILFPVFESYLFFRGCISECLFVFMSICPRACVIVPFCCWISLALWACLWLRDIYMQLTQTHIHTHPHARAS